MKYYVVATTQVEKHVAFLEQFRKLSLPGGKSQLWLDFPNQNIKLFASKDDAAKYSLYLSTQRHWDSQAALSNQITRSYKEWNGNIVVVRPQILPVIYEVTVDEELNLGNEMSEEIHDIQFLNEPMSLHNGSKVTVKYYQHNNPHDLQIEFAAVPFLPLCYYSQLADVKYQVTSTVSNVVDTVSQAGSSIAGYVGGAVSSLLWRQPETPAITEQAASTSVASPR